MDISFSMEPETVRHEQPLKGIVLVSYPGRYDGVVINAQVLDSNHHVTYTSYNGKEISSNVARLFISKDIMPDNRAEFTAKMGFETDRDLEVKFRASIIEQHKEIESATVFVTYPSG